MPKLFKYSTNMKKYIESFLFSIFKLIIKVSYINLFNIKIILYYRLMNYGKNILSINIYF